MYFRLEVSIRNIKFKVIPFQRYHGDIMARTSYIWWVVDDDALFVLNQQVEFDFNSVTSLKHVAAHGHIILFPCQPVFALTPLCWVLNGEATNTSFIVYGLIQLGLESRSTLLLGEHANAALEFCCLEYYSSLYM